MPKINVHDSRFNCWLITTVALGAFLRLLGDGAMTSVCKAFAPKSCLKVAPSGKEHAHVRIDDSGAVYLTPLSCMST